jgi:hypothetical protein
MDVRAIVNPYTRMTNYNQEINWIQSTGYVTNDAGKRTPTTITLTVQAQVQALSGSDLKHIDGLNIQGVMRSVYMFGYPAGVIRADQIGGDILIFPELPGGRPREWLITQVMENWETWSRVLVTLQQE